MLRSPEVLAEVDALRIRDGSKEALVPYDQIVRVQKPLRRGMLYLHLREDTPFGRRIVLLPPSGFTGPVIDLLERRRQYA
jgi:hypothetical protein